MKKMYFAAWIAVMGIALSCNSYKDDKGPLKQLAEVSKLEEPTSASGKGLIADDEAITADSIGRQIPTNTGNHKQQPPAPPQQTDWDKKIEKIASINAEVKDYQSFYSSLREKVKAIGGYIAQEEQNQSDYKIENSLVIKVPVDQFDNALAQLSANTEKINEKRITSDDVTTQLIDTKSRMEAKRQARSRYLDLLKQAKNMEEILHVQNEINGIQEQIESAAGRINYLGHASAFSTINMTYYQVLNVSAKDKGTPSFGTEVANAFNVGWHWIRALFIGAITLWPLLFLIAGAVILYRKTKVNKVKQPLQQGNQAVG
jgi:hypothetical protein